MFVEQRFEAILEELERTHAASVARLCELTGASEATTRRDLTVLASRGLISKVHGGAVLAGSEFEGSEPNVETKNMLHPEEKARIARYSAGLINDDDVVFLDAGTTTYHMLDYLRESKATFVTNSIAGAQRLMELGLKAYVLGGMMKTETGAIVGTSVCEGLERYNFTKAFLGINGITIRQGYTTPDPEEAAIKLKAADQACMTYVLVDSSKFQKVSAITVMPLERAVIITERLPDQAYLEHTIVKEV